MVRRTLQLIKKSAHRIIENLLGIKIHKLRHGCEDWFDIQSSGCQINTIFDVGANIGQSALKFREAFPKSSIYCFEPVSSTFRKLKATVVRDSNINCYSIAFGSSPGNCTIYLPPNSTTSSLIPTPDATGSESVLVKTVDNFASENNIERIDLLKIDTEGFDLEVLKGASHMLSRRRIAFVLAEVGFNPMDKRHVLLMKLDLIFWKKIFRYLVYMINIWNGLARIACVMQTCVSVTRKHLVDNANS